MGQAGHQPIVPKTVPGVLSEHCEGGFPCHTRPKHHGPASQNSNRENLALQTVGSTSCGQMHNVGADGLASQG